MERDAEVEAKILTGIVNNQKLKKKKKVVKKRRQFDCVFITGIKKLKKVSVKYLVKNLKELLVIEDEKFEGYVITGTSRVVEQKTVTACKELKLRVLQAPANFQMFSGASAEQIRNQDVVETFKPKLVIIVGDEEDVEDDDSMVVLKKYLYRKNIPVHILE